MKKQLLLVAVIMALTTACKKSETGLPGKWQQKASLPFSSGRTGAASFSIGGKGYIVGGSDNPVYYNDVYAYDPVTDSWSQKTSCPGNHFLYPAFFVIHDIAYMGICQTEGGYSKEFWAYDPAADGWSRKADYPGSAQFGPPNFAIDELGYVASNGSGTDLWMYDPVVDKWTQKNDVPIGVGNEWAANFVIGNKGYTGGGFSDKFWEYDPVQDSWSSKAPKGGSGFAGASLNGLGYFFSTKGNSFMYNPQQDSWSPVAFYGDRSFGMTFTLNSKIYYACGGNGKDGLLNDFWEFTPE